MFNLGNSLLHNPDATNLRTNDSDAPLYGDRVAPFAGRSFKILHVLARSAQSLLAAAAYTPLALVSSAFSQQAKSHYSSLANYHFMKGACGLAAQYYFGDKLMQFSINAPYSYQQVDKRAMSVEAINDYYGTHSLAPWEELLEGKFPNIYLNTPRIFNVENLSVGCCLGMSLDFIKRYLSNSACGQNPKQAAHLTDPTHADGPSHQAQIMQLMYNKIESFTGLSHRLASLAHMRRSYLEEIAKLTPAQASYLLSRDQPENDRKVAQASLDKFASCRLFSLLPADEKGPAKPPSQSLSQVDLRLNDIEREQAENVQHAIQANEQGIKNAIDYLIRGLDSSNNDRLQAIAGPVGVELAGSSFSISDDPTGNRPLLKKIPELLEKLPPASYLVQLSAGFVKGLGHAIAYIKNENGEDFLHDPNIGTLAVGSLEAASWMSRIVNLYEEKVYKKPVLFLMFTPLRLHADGFPKPAREVIISMLEKDGTQLRGLHDDWKKDVELVRVAMRQNLECLFYVSEELAGDPNIMHDAGLDQKETALQAVRTCWRALLFASEQIRNDPEVVFAAIEDFDSSALIYASKALRADRTFALAVVKKRGDLLRDFEPAIKNDFEIVLEAVKNTDRALQYAGAAVKDNPQIKEAADLAD